LFTNLVFIKVFNFWWGNPTSKHVFFHSNLPLLDFFVSMIFFTRYKLCGFQTHFPKAITNSYASSVSYWHVLLKAWPKKDLHQGATNAKGALLTIKRKAWQSVTLILHIGNYFIQQIVKQSNRSLTCVATTILAVSIASKSPNITWHGTHYEFMKLITKSKVPCPSLDFHKSNEVVVVTHKFNASNTYLSMVLATKNEMACWTICFQYGN
jgi:hypothetical protein